MRITIYQENKPKFIVSKGQKFVKSNYHQVFETFMNCWVDGTEENALDSLFVRFNHPPYPADYKGHSMSVGDIVVFGEDDSGKYESAYVCNMVGWKKINLEDK